METLNNVEKVTVQVTEADIAEATPYTVDQCPVALAVCRALGAERTQVSTGRITVYHGEDRRAWTTPHEVRDFINRFDRRLPVRPFSFPLFLADW
tara:strand:- start:17163 stop:17447 length:285 start_codon:yes stop_codon:yes gene_type:complete